jgi:hypothetical protein
MALVAAEGVAMAGERYPTRPWTGLVGMLMQFFGFGALIAGLAALCGGLLSSDGGPPTCDGGVMRPGDLCRIVVNGQADLVGYEEMVRRQETGLRDGLIIGGTGLGGGAALLLGGRWLFRRSAP